MSVHLAANGQLSLIVLWLEYFFCYFTFEASATTPILQAVAQSAEATWHSWCGD